MPTKIRWGVLGAAKIALGKVIPAMQRGAASTVIAIASRSPDRADRAARSLAIPRSYGSYEALIADADIEAVYIPLPNHLHVPWAIRAAEAGKHVLVEKPIAMSASDAARLVAVRDQTGVMIQEAFMIRAHPQWIAAAEIARSGRIGELRSIIGSFSYYLDDASNIRNVPELGGGALMDVGCYLIHTARWIVGREPARVVASMDRDPRLGIDRLTSMVLDFDGLHAIGTCSTQAVPDQRVQIIGTRGRVEIEIPFNAPPDRGCRILIDDGSALAGAAAVATDFPICDQYTLQGDAFSRAIREGGAQPLALEDSIRNMGVIDAVAASGANGGWVVPALSPSAM